MSSQGEYGTKPPVQVRGCAKALIRTGRRVLLVKERHADGSRFWTLPGGGVRSDESHADALARELGEELQCQVDVFSLIGKSWYAHTSSRSKLSRWSIYRCTLRSRVAPNITEGILSYTWERPEALPERTLPQVRQLLR